MDLQRWVRRMGVLGFALAVLGGLAFLFRSGPSSAGAQAAIWVDGSSTVAPITQAVAAEFRLLRPDIKVSVGISGTGGGFRRFVVGETHISNASRAIKPAEIAQAQENGVPFVEAIVGLDGITVAVSRDTKIFRDGRPCLTVGELELLWAREAEGFIRNWSQLGSRFADAPIALSGAAETSGTFDFFTSAITRREGDTRADYFATEEDQLLAEQTGAHPFGLTYFGFAFFVSNQDRVQAVALDPRRTPIDPPPDVLAEINRRRADSGKPPLQAVGGECRGLRPTPDAIQTFLYRPLSRPLFLYVSAQALELEAVEAFVRFYLSEELIGDDEFMGDVGYVPAPEEVREANRLCLAKRVTGTAFDGRFSDLSSEEIVQKFLAHCGRRSSES